MIGFRFRDQLNVRPLGQDTRLVPLYLRLDVQNDNYVSDSREITSNLKGIDSSTVELQRFNPKVQLNNQQPQGG
jgi:hypothetical protein